MIIGHGRLLGYRFAAPRSTISNWQEEKERVANYLYIIASSQKRSVIFEWFRKYGSEHEYDEKILENGSFTIFIGAQPKLKSSGEFFLGYSLDHAQRCIHFSGQTINTSPSNQLEGCFIRGIRRNGSLSIENDYFAMLPLLFFSEPGVFAASDSFFILAILRSALGFTNKLKQIALLGRAWIGGLAGKLLSNNTPIEAIKFCPPGNGIAICFNEQGDVSVKNTKTNEFSKIMTGRYLDELHLAGEEICAVIRTFAEIKGSYIRLALSGGLDSRALLGAILISTPLAGEVLVGTNPKNKLEFTAAKRVTDHLGLTLNAPAPDIETIRNDRAANWFLSCAGIYDPLYSPPRRTVGRSDFTFGGHGAELYKGNYGWRTMQRIASSLPEPLRSAFQRDVEAGLVALGVAPNDPHGSEWHYAGYRNAIHSGRSTMTSLLGVRPLMNRRLFKLTHSTNNQHPSPKVGEPTLVHDLLILFDSALAELPFSDTRKALEPDYIKGRKLQVGSLSRPAAYKIIGSPKNMPTNPVKFFQTIARFHGFSGDLGSAQIKALVAAGCDKIPDDLVEAYSECARVATIALARGHPLDAKESNAIGKIISFNAFVDL